MKSSNHGPIRALRGRDVATGERSGEAFANQHRTPRRLGGERGFALISALVLAVLYFGLMELMLIDSTRALREAQRFRARLVAATLAENVAELAARQMITAQVARVTYEDWQGTAVGDLRPSQTGFDLTGDATAKGTVPAHASVLIQGHVDAASMTVHIDFTRHSQ